MLVATLLSLSLVACKEGSAPDPALVEFDLGSTRNVHRMGDVILAGQPSLDDWDRVVEAGVQTVITLRHPSELKDYDEQETVTGKGMEFIQIPFNSADELTDNVFEQVRAALKTARQPILLHCASANRVGAVWIPFRVLDEGLAPEDAITEAKTIGLRSAAYQQRAETYLDERVSGSN